MGLLCDFTGLAEGCLSVVDLLTEGLTSEFYDVKDIPMERA